MKIYAQIEPLHIYPYNEVYKTPYTQLPLQPLIRKDPQGPNDNPQGLGLPVNIANGSINVDISKMAAAGMSGGEGEGAGQPGEGGAAGQAGNGWGLLNMMKSTVAAVTPSGQAPQFGAANGAGGAAVPGLSQLPLELKLADGKRLAYRMDYCVKDTGNSYIAAVTSHTAYWQNKETFKY